MSAVTESRCTFHCKLWYTEHVRTSTGTLSCGIVANLSVTMLDGVNDGQLYTISMFSCDIGAKMDIIVHMYRG